MSFTFFLDFAVLALFVCFVFVHSFSAVTLLFYVSVIHVKPDKTLYNIGFSSGV